ncbi:MAG: hypothetical protein C4K60_20890 [Ideonella sp. MAG2]|nr:MAG: hypothetical protein C4K60_20890 [Ideonella sp. MAG2]
MRRVAQPGHASADIPDRTPADPEQSAPHLLRISLLSGSSCHDCSFSGDRPADARQALERLRSRVESHGFPRIGALTVSIGYTELREADTPSAAFDRADQAVYHAKGSGRNCCVDFDLLRLERPLAEPANTGVVEFF